MQSPISWEASKELSQKTQETKINIFLSISNPLAVNATDKHAEDDQKSLVGLEASQNTKEVPEKLALNAGQMGPATRGQADMCHLQF